MKVFFSQKHVVCTKLDIYIFITLVAACGPNEPNEGNPELFFKFIFQDNIKCIIIPIIIQ